jgi:hypothetical protein
VAPHPRGASNRADGEIVPIPIEHFRSVRKERRCGDTVILQNNGGINKLKSLIKATGHAGLEAKIRIRINPVDAALPVHLRKNLPGLANKNLIRAGTFSGAICNDNESGWLCLSHPLKHLTCQLWAAKNQHNHWSTD